LHFVSSVNPNKNTNHYAHKYCAPGLKNVAVHATLLLSGVCTLPCGTVPALAPFCISHSRKCWCNHFCYL